VSVSKALWEQGKSAARKFESQSSQVFKAIRQKSSYTVEIVYNETGYNEQPDITSKFGAEVWSRI